MKKQKSSKKRYGKLGTKISLFTALSFLAVIVILLVMSMKMVQQMTEDIFIRQSSTAAATLARELENISIRITAAAEQLATNRLYGESVRDGTITPMKPALKLGANNASASFGMLVDRQGKVLLTTGTAPTDSLATSGAVTGALGGNTSRAIEPLGECPLAIVTAEPIYADGKVSGALLLVVDLREPATLDRLKGIDGNEYTLFAGDTRISTTILQDGERAVGTTLAPAIADLVIGQGQSYSGRAAILGQEHLCTYLPIAGADGQPIGVLFAGTNSAAMRNQLLLTFESLGVVALVLLLGIVAVLWLLLRLWVTRPLGRLVTISNAIADGNLATTMKGHFGNELGVLAESLGRTVVRLGDYGGYIQEVSAVLGQIADGELDYKLERDYQGEFSSIKTALEMLSERLNHTLRQISHSSALVYEGAHKLSGDSQALAQGTTEQASAVQELSSSISLLSQQVSDNSSNASTATEVAMQVGEDLNSSSTRMQEMTAAMSDISARSAEIGKIIKTIDDIAFQTNILALNAAVEAARAGAAGKGFAVVAGEVRSLAGKSAEAAKSTSELIAHSMSAVRRGNQIADETAASLYVLVEGVAGVAGSMRKITRATAKQSIEIAQVREGIELISSVVQQNSATSEQSAAAAIELSQQSVAMQELVGRFNLKTVSV